jgi:hypothetical protein
MIVNIVKPREGISCAELRFARQRGQNGNQNLKKLG